MARRLTYATIDGGPDRFIDGTHRRAIRLDGIAVIAAGVFSRSHEKSLQMTESPGISPDRCYEDYRTIARAEEEREDGVDFVTMVIPDQSRYEICRAFLEAGIHVVCDKPVTATYRQAKGLKVLVEDKGLLFIITYTYMGYVAVKYARELVASGAIGEVHAVMAEHPQDWLTFEDDFGGKQEGWRYDPGQSGGANCLGDLGIHVESVVAAMTGLKIKRLLAKMDVVMPGWVLNDNDSILMEYDNGVIGIYWTSQVAAGHDNSLGIRIYDSKDIIQWFRETSDKITVVDTSNTIREIHHGYDAIGEEVGECARILARHPEGWFEVMGDLYRSFAQCVSAKRDGTSTAEMVDYPMMSQDAEGLASVEACLESNQNRNTWVEFRRE